MKWRATLERLLRYCAHPLFSKRRLLLQGCPTQTCATRAAEGALILGGADRPKLRSVLLRDDSGLR